MPHLLKSLLTFLILLAPIFGVVASPLVSDLRVRLAKGDVAAVNSYLSSNWNTKMAELGRMVRRCNADSLRLSVELLETTNLEALQGHIFNLELAMGRCPEKLLPLIPLVHVNSVCAVDAYTETHPSTQLSREIKRRMTAIRETKWRTASPAVAACLDAYAAALRAQEQ
jgi:hypothetical protein